MDGIDEIIRKPRRRREREWIPARLNWSILAAAIALPMILGSCAQPTGPTPEQSAAPSAVTLVAGDVIKLTFPGAPELNQSQKIRTDGKVNLPLIGEVQASGKTVPELQNELVQRYKA